MGKTRTKDRYGWCYVSGRAAAIEDRLLSSSALAALADQPDAAALLRALGETPYRDAFQKHEDLAHADRVLDGLWTATLADMRRLSPDPAVVDLFLLETEFQNYKSWIKQRQFDLPGVRLSAGLFSDEDFERAWEGLHTPAFELFARGTARLKGELSGGEATAITVDWVLDAELLNVVARHAADIGSQAIEEAVTEMTRLRTAEIVVRALGQSHDVDSIRRLFIGGLNPSLAETAGEMIAAEAASRLDCLAPYLEPQQLDRLAAMPEGTERNAAVAREVAAAGVRRALPVRAVAFGPERVFAYLVFLSNELRNLRLIVGGRMAGVAPETIKEKMILASER